MPRRASAPTTLPAASVAAAISATANANVAASTASPSDSSPLPSSQPGSSSASTSNAGGAARPRRIMPSRSRRGGPGVGTSDVDTQILETLRRRRENDPLIPAPTQLLLTTDSTRVRTFGGGDAGSQQLNTSAYERYFDKPEVIRAYREQQLIQTPEYTLLSEHEAVGGRFRPRGQDDEGIDTSDVAYEKRHRKYETFEKRQRLREKEKLKHEQYKLKERIEQLRALEPSAFLHVADSFFANSLCPPPHEAGAEQDARANANVVPAQVHCDGEWRKRQILDVANSLEARYRTLLDTAPSRAPELSTPTPAPATPAPVPPPKTATPVPAPNHTPAPTSPVVPRPQPVLPPPEPTEIIELDSDGEEQSPEPVKVEPAHQPLATARLDPNETIRLRIKFPTRPPPPVLPSPIPSPVSAPAAVGAALGSPSPTRPRPKPIFKNPAAPGPYARVPFARRLSLQDGAAYAGTSVPVSSPPTPASTAPHTAPPETTTTTGTEMASPLPARPTPPSATHLTLRRRPARAAAAHLKPVSPIAAMTTASAPPPPAPPPAHAPGLRRPRKRRRIEPSDDVASPASDSYDNNAGAAGVGAGEEEEQEEPEPEEDGEDEDEEGDEEDDEDVPDGGGRRSGAREQRHERWRECALYREAQRHVGAPSARKTHRHLGIFGLRGFPADIEHMRDFVPPAWALPRGDMRLAADATSAVPVVASMGVGAVGAGGTDKEAGQPVEMAVTVAEEVETLLEVGPDMSDPLTTVETPKTVDSQETEDLMLPLNC